MYFVIHIHADGVSIEPLTHVEIEQRLDRGHYPNVTMTADLSDRLHELDNMDIGKVIIIKGEVVEPKPVKYITRWEVP